jgi:phospholipid-translocating ATPase
VYGNDSLLFPSAYFWFGLIITILLALLPRYLFKAWKSIYAPDDIEILRYIHKYHPERMNEEMHYEMEGLGALKRAPSVVSGLSRASSVMEGRRSFDPRTRSRTDMSTGLRSVHRGFDFAEEEGGVAMRRMQTNLSEVRNSSRYLVGEGVEGGRGGRTRRGTRQLSHIFTIKKGKKGLLKRKSEKKD